MTASQPALITGTSSRDKALTSLTGYTTDIITDLAIEFIKKRPLLFE